MRTFAAKKIDVERDWYLLDAEDKILGRIATRIADILRGKTKPIYTPHVDTGDFVIVINAEKVKLTGKKKEQKEYMSKSPYQGGLKKVPFKKVIGKNPEKVIIQAVRGMLPKNKLSSQVLKKLKVYRGLEYPHAAQKPKVLTLSGVE